MPIFQYSGYRTDGSEVAGSIEASSQRDAVLRLKDSGLYPKKVRETVYRGKASLFRRTEAKVLPSVTRQLSTLLASGVTLMEALDAIARENAGFWNSVLISVKENVAAGASFSKSLEEYGALFPEFYVNMVAAGETSGNLHKVLDRLAHFLETQSNLQAKVRTSMVYPAFMICVGFIVLSFLFTFVIPKITKIFQDTEAALPFLTVALIAISHFLQHYWWIVIGALLGMIYGLRRLKEKHRLFLDKILIRTPGRIMQSLYYARFTRTLGFLLEGGLPVLRALELSAKSVGNAVVRQRVIAAAERVGEGGRLSASLDGFPPVLLQLIATGERSGQLVEVLNSAADSYEEEFSRRIQRALALLEPSMILVMGVIVGLIVLAVLLPIFQLNQLIK